MAKKTDKIMVLNDWEYNYEDIVDYKKYISVALIQSQIDTDTVQALLDTNTKLYGLTKEDVNDVNSFGEDLINIAPDKVLTKEEIKTIHSIVDTNVPDDEYVLKNKYYSEEELAEREDGKFDVKTFNPSTKRKVDKTYTRQRDDIEQYVTVIEDTTRRTIHIDYEKLLEIEGLEQMLKDEGMEGLFEHHLQQKSFQGITDKIVNDYNFILNEYKELGIKLFKFRTRMAIEGKKYNIYNFLIDCLEIINDSKLRSIIREIDVSTYTLDLDVKSDQAKGNIIEDLRVTDKINQVILETAILSRLMVPIINEYAVFITNAYGLDYNGKKYMINHYSILIFNYIMRYISVENDVNVISKLYKIIEPRVNATNYSDKVMWRLLESHGFDNDIAINKYINKVIRTIIPKIDTNRSSISFLDVVVRNMIRSDFSHKFTYSNKVINITPDDDDDTSILDKISLTKYHKTNELNDIIINASIDNYIDKEFKRYNITEEILDRVEGYLKNLNEFQIALIKLHYDSIFPSLDKCSKRQLLSLITILRYKMENERFFTLSKLILSKRNNTTDITKTGRIPKDITKSESYKEIRGKFKSLIGKFDKDAYLLKLTSVYNFDFNVYDPVNDEEFVIYSRDMDRKEIASELFEYTLNCVNEVV